MTDATAAPTAPPEVPGESASAVSHCEGGPSHRSNQLSHASSVERSQHGDAPSYDDFDGRSVPDDDIVLSPRAFSIGDGGGGSEYDWDRASPEQPLSPALQSVHRVAVEAMRRSFEAVDKGMLMDQLESIRNANRGEDDDDGMAEEEQSLSSKAARLKQSLTDVSVDDIDRGGALTGVHRASSTDPGGGGGSGADRREVASAVAAAAAAEEAKEAMEAMGKGAQSNTDARGRQGHVGAERDVSGREGGGNGGGSRREGERSETREIANGTKGPDSSGLVLRATPRRPLKEMMRLEETAGEDGGEPAVRLEHLPPFTERWTPEALTPHILSQVFSDLAPVASRLEHGEPACTYMLECCVRPDMEAITMLHMVSSVAAEHGLELVRKRGGQVLYGVAPPTTPITATDARYHQPTRRRSWSIGKDDRAQHVLPSPGPVAPLDGPGPAPSPGVDVPPTPPGSRGENGDDENYQSKSKYRTESSDAAGSEARGAPRSREQSARGMDSRGGEDGGDGSSGVSAVELAGWGSAGGAGWGPWSHVDMQLVVGQASKHRVLLIRFVTTRTAMCRDVLRVSATAAENGQPLAIAPAAQGFVSAVRATLRERGALMEALEECPQQDSRVSLDTHFLAQVEGMCQMDMVASLREAGVSLDEHARNEELRGVVVTRMLEEMFEMVGLPMLPPPPQLVLAVARPNDILPTSVEPMVELSEEDEEELGAHVFVDEASRVMAAVLARCIRYTERCDEQMTARMQRKNRQVMQRISRSQLYQRELFQALRDGHMAVRRAKISAPFTRIVGSRPEVGIDPNIETPVYFCSVVSARRPGTLYLTYWHLCVVTRVPGFGANVVVMDLKDIDAVEMVKLFVGWGIQVRRRVPADGSSPRMSPVPPSLASSASSQPAPRRPNGQPDAAAAAAAAAAAKRARPSSIVVATTKVSTAELRELIVALVRVHREPVTSPSRAEAKAAASAAARASASSTLSSLGL